ncbi:MAG TPA: DUF6364 family protein [Pseudomonadales bacterium]|nr:DUF6364 family protein [Pseudomonadales bacterium]
MKTTLDLDDSLLKKAKALAAHEGISLTLLIEEGLRLRLRRPKTTRAATRSRLPVYKGNGGVARGVDPTSNRAMFEAAGDDA